MDSIHSFHKSHVLIETETFVVERFGSNLPVFVTEAIASANNIASISVNFDAVEWAWLVVGRALYVWKYQHEKKLEEAVPQCRELLLPSSEFSHHTRLITVIPGRNVVSVLAVSPEGIVRYWANAAREENFVDLSADLQGEEGHSLVQALPIGCILSTTTGSLLLLSTSTSPRMEPVSVRPLRMSKGMLSGLGRRVSSFIFGGGVDDSSETNLIRVHVCEQSDDDYSDSREVVVLTDRCLQKWSVNRAGEKMLYECEIDKMIKECLCELAYGTESCHPADILTFLLDVQPCDQGVVVLAAGCNLVRSPDVHYVFATLPTAEPGIPLSFASFVISKLVTTYDPVRMEVLPYKFLLPDTSNDIAYLYDANSLMCASISNSALDVEQQQLTEGNDLILGAGHSHGEAVVFTKKRGFLSVAATPRDQMSTADQFHVTESELTRMIQDDQLHDMTFSEDKSHRFKAAFLHFCRNNLVQARKVVNELQSQTSKLDKLVCTCSKELIDDYPASDPRWAESVPQDMGSTSSSLIILHQLEDKQKAHDYLITFLKRLELWSQLKMIGTDSTHFVLREHAEKLIAAIALRRLHVVYAAVVDGAIKLVMEKRKVTSVGSSLTLQDVFYREVSQMDDIFAALVEGEERLLETDLSTIDAIMLIPIVNSLFEGILTEVLNQRKNRKNEFSVAAGQAYSLPWTASVSKARIRTLLHTQLNITFTCGLSEAADAHSRGVLIRQLYSLTDILLDGYADQVNADIPDDQLRHLQERYETTRYELLSSFLKHKLYEEATLLAEKYQDFRILLEVCDTTDNQEQLEKYTAKFAQQNFSHFMFDWYLREGKQAKLMKQKSVHNEQLGEFLHNHDQLVWLHQINTNDYSQASKVLRSLGMQERDYLTKKKTLLSLSKLAMLCSDETPETVDKEVEELNEAQDLILAQETLPDEVRIEEGLNTDRVLSPRELIQLYVGGSNCRATEIDFRKALDILQFVDKDSDDYEDLKLEIWTAAILRDHWSDLETHEPLESCRKTVFFKTIEKAYIDGFKVAEILPPYQTLLDAGRLGDLTSNKTFQYLLTAGYEQMQRIFSSYL